MCSRPQGSLDLQGPSSRELGWSARTHRAGERRARHEAPPLRSSPAPRLRLLTWPQGITTYTQAGNGKLERKISTKNNPTKASNATPCPSEPEPPQEKKKIRHRPLRYELKWLRPSRLRGCEALPYSLPGQWAGLRLNSRIIGGAQAQSDPRRRAPCVS